MREDDAYFGMLKNLENACRFLRESGSVTVCCMGMFPLLLELYRAIEFYEQMANDFQEYELPQDVTVSDFEYWAHRLFPYEPDSVTADIYPWRREDDRRLSVKDDREVLWKLSRDLVPLSWNKYDGESCLAFCDKVESMREEMEQWNLVDTIDWGFRKLAGVLWKIIETLDSPAQPVLSSLYGEFLEKMYSIRPDNRHRKWKLWKIDHEKREDYLPQLDAWIAELRAEIDIQPYGGKEWNRFFKVEGDQMWVVTEEVGRLLWRNLQQYRDDDDLLCRLYEHLDNWEFSHTERLRLTAQKAEASSCLSKALEKNAEAKDCLVQILKDIYPSINSGRGRHSERKTWIHVYHAWNRLGLLEGEFVPKHFGATVFAICSQRTAESIEKTFAKKDYSEKHLKDSDRDRIAELVTLFLPVRDLLDGAESHADFQKR